ncbi:MAG TPA: hypothetical protein DDW52_03725 [Planctomycetaceae bacterium]|nr:hypothetical protein [Planctomycetaceae bacterium]
MDNASSDADSRASFAEQAESDDIGFLAEFVMFLRENKKWWLVPLVGSLLLIGLVGLLAASGAAPFIYTLF